MDANAPRRGVAAAGAVASEASNSFGNLVVHLAAARAFGMDGFATFALCMAALVLATAVHTGWVGDALTVLDRHRPDVRAALVTSQLVSMSALVPAAFVFGLGVGLTWPGSAAYAGLVAAWLLEDTGRRVLGAQRRFWSIVANDACYLGVAALGLVLAVTQGSLTAGSMFAAMGVGALLASIVARRQSDLTERRLPRPGGLRSLGVLASFSIWRSVAVGLRPLALLVARLLVVGLASRRAFVSVEAARLLLAPAFTIVAGAGTFLLPHYVRGRTGGPQGSVPWSLLTASTVTAAATSVYLAVVLAWRDQIGRLVLGDAVAPTTTALLAWSFFVILFAVSLAPSQWLTAQRRERRVVAARATEAVVGLLCVTAVAGWEPELAPAALALGQVAALGVLWLSVREAIACSTSPPDESASSISA